MPLARGLMIMDRLNVYNTSTAVNVVETAPYTCGETVHFSVTVVNLSSGTPTPTGGTVQLFDLVSSTVLASGTLVSGAVTIPYTLTTGTIKVIAQYLGTNTNPIFSPSVSSSPITISAVVASTTTTLTVPANHVHFCADTDLAFTATVTSTGTPTGNVEFQYSTDTVHFTTFATVALSGGSANATLPANTLTGSSSGNEVYFQAVYVGGACFSASSSVVNDGYAYSGLSTATSINFPTSGSTETDAPAVVMNVGVTSTITVNSGNVTLWYAFSPEPSPTPPANFPTGWATVPIHNPGVTSGLAQNPVPVASNTAVFDFPADGPGGNSFFFPFGNYYFVAVYSDGTCFSGSMSNGVGTEAYFLVAAGT